MRKPLREHSIELTVPFFDVDLMQVAWHGHYVKYFEQARCALLETFNYDYKEMLASRYAWPISDLRIRYSRPARFGQKLKVTASLVEWENRLRIEYRIRDAATGGLLTKGETTQVAVDMVTGELCFVSPDVLFERLGVKKP